MTVALPAVDSEKNCVRPPGAPLPVPPLLTKVALPPVEKSSNHVMPPGTKRTGLPLFVNLVKLPAVALLINRTVVNSVSSPLTEVTKFWVIPELFVIPVPLMVRLSMGLGVIVNALAPALNTMLLTSVLAETETPVVLDEAKVAVSAGPLGMVGGVQFAAWFQSPVGGLVFHVALSAKALLAAESRSSNIATVTNNNGNRRCGRGEGIASDIDEERPIVFFMILFFQMIGASPRRCRRRPPSAAAGRIWCGAVASQILLSRGFTSQDKNARCGKTFAAQQRTFEPDQRFVLGIALHTAMTK
jgi:hypothetical protein